MVLLGKILALLGHNEREKLEFCPFFKSVVKILFSSVFLSCSLLLCAFFSSKETKKRRRCGREKILFCSLTLHTKERKGRKNSFSLLLKEEALSEAL